MIFFFSFHANGQSCNCPAINTCAACIGGLYSLTLRFNGSESSEVTASDQLGVRFNGILNEGDIFTFTGSIPNEKFVGANVTLTVAGLSNASIGTLCSSSVFVGNTYGSFTVVAGQSLNGGAICCAPSLIETIPPVISNCPEAITVSIGVDACSASVDWVAPTASDNCEIFSFTSTHNPGDIFQMGVTEVAYTAIDIYGNTSLCSFNITVKNRNPPVISECPDDITIKTDGPGGVSVTWESPTATVECGEVTLISSHEPGSMFQIGVTDVEYEALDDFGGSATCGFKVNVFIDEGIFEIAKAVTPNDDGINDVWTVKNIEKFRHNKVLIVDRFGREVFQASAYDNEKVVWKGVNRQGSVVPTGTYFYTLDVWLGNIQVEKKGFIEVIR